VPRNIGSVTSVTKNTLSCHASLCLTALCLTACFGCLGYMAAHYQLSALISETTYQHKKTRNFGYFSNFTHRKKSTQNALGLQKIELRK